MQVGKVWDFPRDGGATIKYGKTQIAVFNFASRGEWYATQNMCPHRREFVLSRGMIGDQNGKPKLPARFTRKPFRWNPASASAAKIIPSGFSRKGGRRRCVSGIAAGRSLG